MAKRAPRKGEGRPTKYTPDILVKTKEYIAKCEDEIYVFQKMSGKTDGFEEKIKTHLPTIVGLALYLNVDENTCGNWANKYPEFLGAFMRVKQLQHQALLDGGLSNRYNPLIAKLILSTNHGYRDNKDITSDGKAIKGNSIIFTDFKNETKGK